MSSTRTAKNDSTLHQERYASSPEFERGLMATRVAALCDTIEATGDRELIWFIQYLSHQEGGLASFAGDLLKKYPERVGTATMLKLARDAKGDFNAAEVLLIRRELPRVERRHFPLKGESEWDLHHEQWSVPPVKIRGDDGRYHELQELADLSIIRCDDSDWERKQREAKERELADKHPASYPVIALRELCWKAAQSGIEPYKYNEKGTYSLERELAEMCLDPERDFAAGGPWYFPSLVETLREYMADFKKAKGAGVVVTALGREVYDGLDYTISERVLCLMHGEARTGKSFAARAWCEQNPGCARFIEVPPFADDVGFFRAIARGLGLGNFLNYKANEIRDRVQSVLLAKHRDLILIFDEAQRLWPSSWRQKPEPKRIIWVMTMANAGVPIAMIATPQFIQTQKAVEKAGWNSAQLTGRIGHYVDLPADLSADNLEAVAKSKLPGVEKEALRAVAVYARTSSRYLAAIDSVAKRARYLSKKAGRETITTEDVRRAMQESVIPSDTKLHQAFGAAKISTPAIAIPGDLIPVPETPAPEEIIKPRNRVSRSDPPAPALPANRGNLTEVVPG